MPVDNPQLKIDPYQSTVPLVQIPREDMQEPPAAPRIYSRGAGIAELGNDIFRGMMRGLQAKEERKYTQAQATVGALDKQTQDAYDNYQRALATGKKEEADAAYGVYLKTFNDAKQAKAQFAIPDKKPKEKGAKGKKDEQQASGFGASLKQFFERNPHIIPELSLLAMQPKPPGPSVETVRTQQEIKAADTAQRESEAKEAEQQRRVGAEQIYDTLGKKPLDQLSPEEVQKLDWAKSVLYPEKFTGRFFVYKSPDGSQKEAFHPGEEPPGWQIEDKPGAEPKLGTVGDFLNTVASDNKIGADKLNAGQKGYLEQLWHFYQQNPSAATATSWYLDDKGNWQTRTAPNYRGPVAPKPPAGLFPSSFILPGANRAPSAAGGITAPPAQAQAAPTSRSMTAPPGRAPAAARPAAAQKTAGITAAPGQKPLRSWQATQNTEKVETQKAGRYQKAQDTYQKALQSAFKTAKTQAAMDSAKKQAQEAYWKSILETEKWYAQQVKTVGGTYQGTWTAPNGKTYVADSPEALIGAMRDMTQAQQ